MFAEPLDYVRGRFWLCKRVLCPVPTTTIKVLNCSNRADSSLAVICDYIILSPPPPRKLAEAVTFQVVPMLESVDCHQPYHTEAPVGLT